MRVSSGCLSALAFLWLNVWGLGLNAEPLHLFVSPHGNDGCSGRRASRGLLVRKEGPFRTLERARDTIRALRKAGGLPDDGVVVELTRGVHRREAAFELTAEDSGTRGAPVVYRARERGTAIISGGVVVTMWRPVSTPPIADRLAPEAEGRVVWTEIPPGLLDEIPGFANGGCGYRGRREFPLALFQDGVRLPVARWPDRTYTNMGECLGKSRERGHAGICYTDGVFRFDNERLARWVGEPDLWFNGLWFHAWADQKMRLKAIDLEDKTISLLDPQSHHFGFRHGRPFYTFNAISEIDCPGEWAIDRPTRRLYLWPRTPLRSSPVTLAVRAGLVVGNGLSNVRFEGLVFEACRERALVFRDTEGVTVSGCTLRHLGSTAIELDGGTDGIVLGCDFHDLGEGGVIARGGIYETLTPGNHLIENNIDLPGDPGFVDREGLDLRLRPDAPVFSAVPGFAPIPFEKFGLYEDPGRASPAVKFGPHVSPMPRIVSPAERMKARLPIPVSVPAAGQGGTCDGLVSENEWPDACEMPGLRWGRDEEEAPFPSRVWIGVAGASLCVALHNEIAPSVKATRGHCWGKDDGVEIACAPARTARLPARIATVVLRGYADGAFESVTDGGLPEEDAARVAAGTSYEAKRLGKGAWSAEWRIPLAALGLEPSETNWPILAHITARKPVGDHWVGWRRRFAADTWTVRGAYALCLEPFGSVPFIPAFPTSAVRIDVQGDRNAPDLSMAPGTGTDAPAWARKWNRLVAAFGAARADQWQQCRFEFLPLADATVTLELMGTQSLGEKPLVWTYYDDVKVEGAELVNGDFELSDDAGNCIGWNCVLDQHFETVAKGLAGVVRMPGTAASGQHMARTSHDHRVTQAIRIVKGRKVTVEFKARGVLPDWPVATACAGR